MLKKLFYLVCVLLTAEIGVAATDLIVPSRDITYTGRFKLPSAGTGNRWTCFDGAGYNNPGMSITADGNLYIIGGPDTACGSVAKVSVPTPLSGTDTAYADLVEGTMSQDLVQVGDKVLAGTYLRLGDIQYMAAKGSQDTDKIYLTYYWSYAADGDYIIGQIEGNLDDVGLPTSVFWSLTGKNANQYGKILFNAPDAWANEHTSGRSLIASYYRGGGGQSAGPTMYAFAPWDHCSGDCDTNPPANDTSMSITTLLEYGGARFGSSEILDEMTVNTAFSDAEWITVGGKSAVVFFGQKRSRVISRTEQCYGYYPPFDTSTASGFSDSPGRSVFWFFDPDDFAKVAQGGNSFEPQPYAVMDLGPYFYSGYTSSKVEHGLAWSETNSTLYVRECNNDFDSGEERDCAVHVFAFADTAEVLDTTSPSQPVLSLETATHEQAGLTWTASADESTTEVTYEIWRNGLPIAYQNTTTYTDTLLEYYHSPVEYYVKAIDRNGNKNQSNSIFVDDSNGGNAPIAIFVPGIAGGYCHESSSLPYLSSESDYSFTPATVGGAGGNTWSQSGLETNLIINASTGNISGTPTGDYDNKNAVLEINDNSGNLFRQKVRCRISDTADKDGDGYEPPSDIEEYSINIHPDNPTQPAPKILSLSPVDDEAMKLTWSPAQQRIGVVKSGSDERFWGEITYVIHHGTSSGNYTTHTYVGRAKRDSDNKPYFIVEGLSADTHYFAITAYDFRGLESDYSCEVNNSNVQNCGSPKPAAPTGFLLRRKNDDIGSCFVTCLFPIL